MSSLKSLDEYLFSIHPESKKNERAFTLIKGLNTYFFPKKKNLITLGKHPQPNKDIDEAIHSTWMKNCKAAKKSLIKTMRIHPYSKDDYERKSLRCELWKENPHATVLLPCVINSIFNKKNQDFLKFLMNRFLKDISDLRYDIKNKRYELYSSPFAESNKRDDNKDAMLNMAYSNVDDFIKRYVSCHTHLYSFISGLQRICSLDYARSSPGVVIDTTEIFTFEEKHFDLFDFSIPITSRNRYGGRSSVSLYTEVFYGLIDIVGFKPKNNTDISLRHISTPNIAYTFKVKHCRYSPRLSQYKPEPVLIDENSKYLKHHNIVINKNKVYPA